MTRPLVEVEGLSVYFRRAGGESKVISDVSFSISQGERVGMVGESGCGKTVTGLSLLSLLPADIARVTGRVVFDGVDLLAMSEKAWQGFRGRNVAMIFQEPMSALDPVFTIGQQISETIRAHFNISAEEARAQSIDSLAAVGIPLPALRYDEYPHQLSGGMRQRAMIAIALSCQPKLLIADEPTTALDVTVQAQIIDVLLESTQRTGTALLFITHDLGVIAEACTRILTMYAGELVEDGAVDDILVRPRHPYTSGLLRSIPRLGKPKTPLASIPGRVPSLRNRTAACQFLDRCAYALSGCADPQPLYDLGGSKVRCSRHADLALPGAIGSGVGQDPRMNQAVDASIPILSAADLRVYFPSGKKGETIKAVDGVSFDVQPGESFGIIGESGSGKSTLGRTLVGLAEPTSGAVRHGGADPFAMKRQAFARHRRDFQVISQDPNASFDPRMTIGQSVREPLDIDGRMSAIEKQRRVLDLLDRVGLAAEYAQRYPHELSGGQKQRASIARALALNPRLLICDEVVAALDVSIQADILNLFAELQHALGLTYVFITHDLGVVSHMADRIAVMYLGKIVELGTALQIMSSPQHPYTRALLSAEPLPLPAAMRSQRRIMLQGEIPSPINPPSGCRFRTRCWLASKVCEEIEPEWRRHASGHFIACHQPDLAAPQKA